MKELQTKEIEQYCVSKSSGAGELVRELEAYTKENVLNSEMLIGPLGGSLLGFLIRLSGAKKILEIGTFTGYSALTMAGQLPDDGVLITLDVNPETVDLGKSYWNKSPHGKKITSIIGPALESLENLEGPFDLVFIDADKGNYLNYLKHSLKKLSPGGVIILDNALWGGEVLNKTPEDSSARALQEVNDYIAQTKNLQGTLLPVRDGIFLVQKI